MTDARGTLAMIDEFVALALERRQRQLPSDQRERMEGLDDALRELIDGAKPAPKRIANPSAAKGSGPATPAPKTNGAAAKKPTLASALDDALDISSTDQKKMRNVKVAKSGYTPPRVPAFMQDYFSEDIVPVAITADVVPTSVTDGAGETVDLSKEMRVLLGLDKPPPPAPSPQEDGKTVKRGHSTTERSGTPAIVHLVAGGTKRGNVEAFRPSTGGFELVNKSGKTEQVKLPEVLAIFFGATKTTPSIDAAGTALVVKLVNDRQISGLSPDYAEGAQALTIVPNAKRGNIDRIWIPAWAVKAIEFA